MLVLPQALYHRQTAANPSPSHSWLEQARLADWQVDASALQNFDSSALALLLDLRRAAMAAGSVLKLLHAPARLTQLANLYGVNELIS